jgi:exodeoxyribonuclease-3
MKLISWNINGIRAAHRKGFLDWLQESKAEVICIQESKAHEHQFPEDLKTIPGYFLYVSAAERKGYSGVAVWTRIKPISVKTQFGNPALDGEGRILELEFDDFFLFNVYFPNGKSSADRLQYKMDFYNTFLRYIQKKKKAVVFCGDVNTAHTADDLARPKENEKVSGFLPSERAWIDTVLAKGFLDTFRLFHKGNGHYTWWDIKSRARERNVGWRIDYFFADKALEKRIKKAEILSETEGSDHCPVSLELL